MKRHVLKEWEPNSESDCVLTRTNLANSLLLESRSHQPFKEDRLLGNRTRETNGHLKVDHLLFYNIFVTLFIVVAKRNIICTLIIHEFNVQRNVNPNL